MGLLDFLSSHKSRGASDYFSSVSYKMAHGALPYALFQDFAATTQAWVAGELGYAVYEAVANVVIPDPATRLGHYAAIKTLKAFPIEVEILSSTSVYLTLQYRRHERGVLAPHPPLAPLYSIATIANSDVGRTNYYILEKGQEEQTKLLRVDKYIREYDFGLGPAPIPSLIKAMILEIERAGCSTANTETKQTSKATKDERYYGNVLGLSGRLSKAEITKQYKAQIAKYHPDKVQHLGTEFQLMAEQKAKEINEAYEFFCNKYSLD
jgi:hypothetical protein